MIMQSLARGARVSALSAALLVSLAPLPSWGQSAWRPEKQVELIIPTAPGANNDRMVRLIQKALQDQKLVLTPVVALNRPGGNQHLAVIHLGSRGADPHMLLLTNPTVFTNELSGVSPQHYTSLTPLALLVVESNAITVKADSPIKTMRDLMDRLKADPDAVSFAMPSRGGVPHLTLAAAAKLSGVDPKKLKVVVFKASGESITAVTGGHVHAMASSLASVIPHVRAGTLRVLAIAAGTRRGGAAAHVPTLREQGIATDGVAAWRGMSGPKGLSPAHVAFWDDALGKAVDAPEWKSFLEENDLSSQFLRSRDFAKYLEGEYATTRAVMADLGLLK
jgi:putative tricarboxylic transport membrane protein